MKKVNRTAGKSEKVTVNQLLELLPDDLLGQLAADLNADKWVRKLPAVTTFKLVLYSLLNSERLSLRVLESNFSDPMFQAMLPIITSDEVTWTGIRERLMNLQVDFCRKLYELIYQKLQQLYDSKSIGNYYLKRHDSTMIMVFAHLLQGIKVGNASKGKTQIKLTTELAGDFLIQMHFHKDQAYLSEERAMKEAILSSTHRSDEISIFDKGLKSRETFGQFDQQGILFVGRLCGEPRYELLHPLPQQDSTGDTEELEFVQDSAVHLFESGTGAVKVKLRLVQFRLRTDGQLLSFVTNVWELPANVIAEIYRKRWDIEVLFRFLKQEMNLTHFVCNDINAIRVMLYFNMIAAMLVLIYKRQNGIASYKMAKIRFFKELFYSIMLDLIESPEGLDWLRITAKKFVQRERMDFS